MSQAEAKILVVDDDQQTRELLTQLLTLKGYKVSVHDEGCDVLTIARKEKPDLMLLDLGIPCEDGFVVLSKIKKDEILTNIPLFVFSGRVNIDEQVSELGLGKVNFIAKPAHPKELLERIKGALER